MPVSALVATGDYEPTSFQVSAPSQLSKVTSKFDVELLFSHGWPLLNNRECLELMTACRSSAEMCTCSEAKSRARFRRASVIEG